MNEFEKRKRMDKVMKVSIVIFLILAIIAAIAFIIATKDVGQAIFLKPTI